MDALKKYEPIFNHKNDTIAFIVHITFLQRNCQLVGLKDKEYNLEKGSTPQGWNKSSELYQFRYTINKSKPSKNETVLIKIISMDSNTLIISGINQSNKKNKLFTINININDHLNKKYSLKKYNTIYKNINGLIDLINSQIRDKILPKIEKKKEKNEEKMNNPLLIEQIQPRIPGFGQQPVGPYNPFGNNPLGGYGNGDLNPGGIGGGMLIGPNNIGRGGRRGRPKYDPFGPSPNGGGMGGPNPDMFKPPGGGFGGGFL